MTDSKFSFSLSGDNIVTCKYCEVKKFVLTPMYRAGHQGVQNIGAVTFNL